MVISSSDVSAGDYCKSSCGWHQQGPIWGRTVKYAWIGDPSNCRACQPNALVKDQFLWWSYGADKAPNNLVTDSMASVVRGCVPMRRNASSC